MNYDLLLSWMTHKGDGSWAGFRKALSELASDASDGQTLARQMRVAFSDLGHVDFFIDGSQKWRTLPPMLAGSAANDCVAVLCGSRTPELVRFLHLAAPAFACRLSTTESINGPTCIEVLGQPNNIQQVADKAELRWVPNASAQLLGVVDSIPEKVESAPHDQRPYNWDVECFDLITRTWVEGIQRNSACRFTPRHGASRFLLHRRHGKFLQLSKRDAIYASAMIQGVNFLEYDPRTKVLTAPIATPLPEKLARIACLCTGAQPRLDGGFIEYFGVPFDIASSVFVAAGQRHPGLPAFAESQRCGIG